MKKYFVLFVILFVAAAAFSQDSIPVFKRFPTVPPFKILNVADSSIFVKNDLKNKKATMIMMFSPDCDHCQHATKELLANVDKFKKVQIVMAAYAGYDMVKKFYQDYGIATQPNITMGTDQGYFLTTFYSIRYYPSVFLYDKKGKLVKYYEREIDFSAMAKDL